jgi:hypothetical protein
MLPAFGVLLNGREQIHQLGFIRSEDPSFS